MDSAAASELQRRRERARIAQRAFRTRQAAAMRELREENARLKAVIEDVVDADRGHDRAALRSVISRAAGVAGLTSKVPDENRDPDEITNAVPSASISAEKPWLVDISPTVSLGRQVWSSTTFRLDSGLLNASTYTDRIVDPPLDIIPYLGPNRHSLAGQIYWYCTEASLTLLYRLGGQHPSRAGVIVRQHPFFASMLRYSSAFCSHNYIIALAEARLQFCRAGYCRGDNPAAAKDSSIILRDRIEQIHRAAEEVGGEEWLGSTRVAQLVRETLRRELIGRLDGAVRNESTAQDLAARQALQGFIHGLWLESTCFGDGPRWKISSVRTLVKRLARGLGSC